MYTTFRCLSWTILCFFIFVFSKYIYLFAINFPSAFRYILEIPLNSFEFVESLTLIFYFDIFLVVLPSTSMDHFVSNLPFNVSESVILLPLGGISNTRI